MISTALILASAAYAQSRIAPAGVMYYSANQNQVIIPGVGIAPATGDCQGAPDTFAIGQEFIDEGRGGCEPSQCLPKGEGAGLLGVGFGICNLNLDDVESIRKVIAETFGSTPYVVSEAYADDKCTEIQQLRAWKANGECIPFNVPLSWSINENGLTTSQQGGVRCQQRFLGERLSNRTTTIPTAALSKCHRFEINDSNGPVWSFRGYGILYHSSQIPKLNTTSTSTTSGTNSPATSTSVTNPTGKPTTTSNPSYSSAWGIAASLPITLFVSALGLLL